MTSGGVSVSEGSVTQTETEEWRHRQCGFAGVYGPRTSSGSSSLYTVAGILIPWSGNTSTFSSPSGFGN